MMNEQHGDDLTANPIHDSVGSIDEFTKIVSVRLGDHPSLEWESLEHAHPLEKAAKPSGSRLGPVLRDVIECRLSLLQSTK